MKQGIEKNEEKIVSRLMEEAASLFFSEIEPRQKKGEISNDVASSILEALAEADEMAVNDIEKLNIVEFQINNMKRILEQGTHIEQNKGYGYILDKKEYAENLEESVAEAVEKKVEEKKEDNGIKDEGLKIITSYNLLNFRKDIKKAREDLQDQRHDKLDEINEIVKELNSLKEEDMLNNEADQGRLNNKLNILYNELSFLDDRIAFYQKIEKSEEPENEIKEVFAKKIIDEGEKDVLLHLLNPEYKSKEKGEEYIVQEEDKINAKGINLGALKELEKDYLNSEDIFYAAFSKWFFEKKDLRNKGKISDKKFNQIEELYHKLSIPLMGDYALNIENACDTGVINENDYDELFSLSKKYDDYIYARNSKQSDEYFKEKTKKEEEDFLKNLDKEYKEIEDDEEEIKKRREIKKKARNLGIDTYGRKKGFSKEEEEEIEEIRKAAENIPREILEILDDARGYKALANWYLRKIKDRKEYDAKTREYIEKINRFLAEKDKKIDEYNRAYEIHKKQTKERIEKLENVPDEDIIKRPIRNMKTGAKIKDLIELREKFDKIIKELESHLEDNYDRGKIKTKEYREEAKTLRRFYKSNDVKEVKTAVEDYFKKGIINKQDKKELLSNLNGYVKK